MTDALAEFASIFGIILIVVLVVGWQSGWFIGDTTPKAPRQSVSREPVSTKLARRGTAKHQQTEERPRRDARARREDLKAAREEAEREAAALVAARNDNQPAAVSINADAQNEDVHPAVAAAARAAGIRTAERSLPDHWAIDTVQARPGWMLFDPGDFLGPASTHMSYTVPGARRPGTIAMYAIDDVRHAERTNTIIATSRRKVIATRWTARTRKRAASQRTTLVRIKPATNTGS